MKEYFEINNQFRKYLPIFLIMISIIVLMGTSYALLRSSQVGSNTYVMNVGLLEITFVDSKTDAFTVENMVPITDEEGINLENELVFAIKNTGTMTSSYDLYIEETSTNPEFKEVIRYISNKNDKGYNEPKTLSDDKYIEKGNILKVGEEANYKVKVWLDENANSTYMNKEFKARIVVDSVQLAATPTSCFDYTWRNSTVHNKNITEAEVGLCVDYLSQVWDVENNPLPEGDTLESFCQGTGTVGGITFKGYLYNNLFYEEDITYFFENNIIKEERNMIIYGYDISCGEDVVFPKAINGKIVTEIVNTCFTDLFPVSNESIGDISFNNLVFDDSEKNNHVSQIDCESGLFGMKRIVIPNTVKTLGEYVFTSFGLTSVIFEENSSLEAIGFNAFYNNNLTTIEIPDSVIYIDVEAFSDNNLTTIEIPESVETIKSNAFSDNNLKEVKFNSGLIEIYDYAFKNNDIIEVTIPDSVTTLSCVGFDEGVIVNKRDDLVCRYTTPI